MKRPDALAVVTAFKLASTRRAKPEETPAA